MDTVNEVQNVTTDTQAQQTNAVSAETHTPDKVLQEVQTSEKTAEASAVPAYTPNFKFKNLDKEMEVDEWIRPVVKDAETEKKVRELYEKAYGLDHVKQSREKLNSDFQKVNTEYQALHSTISEALHFRDKGDLDSFFEKVGVNPQQVAKWIIDKAQRENLPPEQRQVYDELEAKRRAEYYQTKQLGEYDQKLMQLQTQAREFELDRWLDKPDVVGVAKNYDTLNGQGEFKRRVAEYGVMHFHTYGEDPSVEMAVSAVLKRLGNGYQSQPAPNPPTTAAVEKPLPVIPNVSGKNVSPTRKTPKSIEDIRKIANELGA